MAPTEIARHLGITRRTRSHRDRAAALSSGGGDPVGGRGWSPEPLDSSNEIDVLMRDAEARLAAARILKGSRIGNFR
jgi:hypothetical protein